MKKILHGFAVALIFVALFFASRSARAFCGFYVSGADTKLYNNATQVVIMRDGLHTALSMQNNYEGPPENFAMVVPVPVILQQDNVKTLPRVIFDRVEQLDAPRLVEYWEQDPCAVDEEASERKRGASMHKSLALPQAANASADFGVTVEAQFTVGEYQIVILSAKDGLGLEGWLTQEHYKIPEGSGPFFKPYIDQGSKFFVAKVDVSKVKMENGMAMLSPLRFSYDSDRFSLPVRLGLVNAKDTQDIVVHILAKQRYELSNYNNVFIPTNIDVSNDTRENFAAFYAALFDNTLEKNPKSVVTEYSWAASSCDPCPTPGLNAGELVTLGEDVMTDAKVDAGAGAAPDKPLPRNGFRRRGGWSPWTLTRLHARYTKESLGEDLVFRAADPVTGGRESFDTTGGVETGGKKGPASAPNTFQARYVIRHPWAGAIECKAPRRGMWGPPPRGDSGMTASPSPMPARNLAFAPRGHTNLASYVKSSVPELGLPGPIPGKPEFSVTPSDSSDVPPPKKGCGCSVVSHVDADEKTIASCAIVALAFVVRRRRKKMHSA